MAAIAHVFLMHGMKVATLYPDFPIAVFLKFGTDILVCIHYKTFRIRYAVAKKKPCHLFTGAVFNSIAGIDYKMSLVFKMHQFFYRSFFPTHVEYDVLGNVTVLKLLFIINPYLAAALTQLVSDGIEYSRVIPLYGSVNTRRRASPPQF